MGPYLCLNRTHEFDTGARGCDGGVTSCGFDGGSMCFGRAMHDKPLYMYSGQINLFQILILGNGIEDFEKKVNQTLVIPCQFMNTICHVFVITVSIKKKEINTRTYFRFMEVKGLVLSQTIEQWNDILYLITFI